MVAPLDDDVGIEEQFSGCLQVTSILISPELKGQLGENILSPQHSTPRICDTIRDCSMNAVKFGGKGVSRCSS